MAYRHASVCDEMRRRASAQPTELMREKHDMILATGVRAAGSLLRQRELEQAHVAAPGLDAPRTAPPGGAAHGPPKIVTNLIDTILGSQTWPYPISAAPEHGAPGSDRNHLTNYGTH